MLKKAVKSALTWMLCVALAVSVTTVASAVGRNAIHIKIGDSELNIAPVLLHEGRTYAPYDELFEALEADAVYDEQTGMITAVKGDTEISIELDDYYISVTTDGVQQWIYTGAPTIIDTSGSMVFVPLRYTAQALGYVVGWDPSTRSIVLKTVEQLIEESGATYTVMDSYLAFTNDFNEKCHSVDGSFFAEINMDYLMGYGDEESTPLTMSGTVSGLIDPGGEEMSLNLKTNLSDMMDQLEGLYGEEPDEETQALYDQLDDLDISLIANNEDGIIYIKSSLFSALADEDEDTWFSIETGESLSLSDLDVMSDVLSINEYLSKDASFKEYIALMLKDVLLLDEGGETEEALEQLNSMFSDQAMVRDGDDYVITMITTENDYGYEYSDTFELRFSFDGEEFKGVTADIASTMSYTYWDDYTYESSMETSYSFTADGQSNLMMSSSEDGVTYLTFDMSFTYTETDELPAREPAEGSTIVSLDDIMYDTFEEFEESDEIY